MASDGSVRITVKANDSDLKDLLKIIKDLKQQLDNMSGTNPFDSIRKSAQSAVQSFTGISDSSDKLSDSLDNVGDAATKTDDKLSKVDAENIADVGSSADRSSGELSEMGDAAKKASDGIDQIDPKPVGETEKQTTSLKFSLLDLAKSALVVKTLSAGFDMLKNSVDRAVDRFDTLTIYPRTMDALGFSTGQVDRSMRKLDQGISGLPTTLNDIVSSTQRIASVTGDLDKATDTALALNNAFLANGSSASDASRGAEQYVQMLSRGEVDMQSWRTLQETMTYALNKTADAFGFAGASAQNDLYSALKSGNITFDEFNAKIIELSNEVGGFADLAQTNSASLRTAWTNIQTAFVRGTANIIGKLDELSKAITGRSITENVNKLQSVVNVGFKLIGKSIDSVTPIIIGTADAFKWFLNTISPVTPLLKGVAAGFAALVIINKVRTYTQGLSTVTDALIRVMTYQALGIKTVTAANVQASAVTKLLAVSYGVLTGSIGLQTAVLAGASKAWIVLKTTITALTGPVGWVIGAIGLAVGALVTLKNTVGKTSPEMKELTSEIEDAAGATSSLSDEIDQSSDSFKSARDRLEGQTQTMRNLIDETVALSNQERLSSADKKILKDNIDELNSSMEGLNLTYDEEQGKLTSSTEALESRVKMMEEEGKMAESQKRLAEISEQRALATSQLDENSRKLDEAQRLLDESGFNWFGRNNDLKDSVSQLSEENEVLQERINSLAEDEVAANQMRIESAESYAAAQEEASSYAITSLESLTESQRTAAESMRSEYQSLVEKARDWSTAIETEYTKTNEAGEEYVVSSQEAFADAKATLEENVEAMRQWSESMGALAERGVDEGILEQLRSMGPEGLPLVEGFVNASDEELAEMENLFGESARLSKEALTNGLRIEEGTVIEGAEELIFNTGTTLETAVKSSGLSKIVPDSLKEGKEDMIQAGIDVAEGAAQGILQGSSAVSDASSDLAGKADDSFKSELGIHSPSTVFAQHGKDIINGLLQGFSQGRSQVLVSVYKLGSDINTAMTQSLKTMNTGSATSLSGFVKNVQDSFKNANTVVKAEATSMNTVTQQGFSKMRTSTQQEMNLITKTIEQNSKKQQLVVQSGMVIQLSAVQSGMRNQSSAVKSGYNGMVSHIRSSMGQAVSTTQSAMNQAVSVMRNTSGQAWNAGYNMGLGFRNGLASTQGGIMATAINIANQAAGAIRSALRIHSPSRVTEALGKFTGEGMIVGMEGTLRDVAQMADEMARRAMPRVNMGTSLGFVASGGGSSSSSASFGTRNDMSKVEQLLEVIASKEFAAYIGVEEIVDRTHKPMSKRIKEENAWQSRGSGVL